MSLIDSVDRFLAVRGLAPHGYCLLWDPALVWSHVIADTVIAAAYFSIPVVLYQFWRKRRDLQFGWLLLLFAIFITACGLTHVMGIFTLWVPAYGWEAMIKVMTALASLVTAIVLVPLLPRLLAIPSPAALQRVNAALEAEAKERERTESMLRQAQKMEAMGQLTGGVAHDFNNLLAIVIGNLDRARRKGGCDAAASKALDDAMLAAERAARVTDQLLAFARRQPLAPQPHDVEEIVWELAPLIEQTLGPEVSLTVRTEPGLPPAVVDRNQLENALLNLALNARDAMPKGGAVTIEAAADGVEMVRLSVIDTGTGMDAETIARATEPFFTTKPVGKGSGLGLSQAFGMVQQLGGKLSIDSSPGSGTRVSLYLPVHDKR